MGMSINGGTPKTDVYKENPIKIGDKWGTSKRFFKSTNWFWNCVKSHNGTPLDEEAKNQLTGRRDADVRQTLFWQVLLCER